MPRQLGALPLALGLLLFFQAIPAHAGTIDFEDLTDSTIVTDQYPGLTFTNTTVLTVGVSLNEFELPPHSGVNVASDNGGPISIAFDTPILSFGGYFTYYEPLTLQAFAVSDAQVASATSAFSINVACGDGPPCLGDSGSSPNEFLQVSFADGISSVTITGDPAGGSFVMDDITFSSAVPEPDSLFLVLTCAAVLLPLSRKLR